MTDSTKPQIFIKDTAIEASTVSDLPDKNPEQLEHARGNEADSGPSHDVLSSILATHTEALIRGMQSYVQVVEAALVPVTPDHPTSASCTSPAGHNNLATTLSRILEEQEHRIAETYPVALRSLLANLPEQCSHSIGDVPESAALEQKNNDLRQGLCGSESDSGPKPPLYISRRCAVGKAMAVSPYDFAELPIEIAQEIIMIATWESSNDELSKISRVCKTIHNWVTPILYRSVFLSNEESIALFAATMEQTPRLRILVTELWMFLAERRKPFVRREAHSDDSISEIFSEKSASESSYVDDSEDSDDSEIDAEMDPSELALGNPTSYAVTSPITQGVNKYEFVFDHIDTQVSSSWRTVQPRLSRTLEALCPVVQEESYVHAYALLITQLCTSLQGLHCPSDFFDPLQHASAALPLCPLTSLTIYKDLDNWPFELDGSRIKRLTVLNNHYHGPDIFSQISHFFPNLSHLRIPLRLGDVEFSTLPLLKCLTHLWFTPSPLPVDENRSLASFLGSLPETIVRIRLDIVPEALPKGFEEVGWDSTMFPVVNVHRYEGEDTSWRAGKMWTEVKPVNNHNDDKLNPNEEEHQNMDAALDSGSDFESDERPQLPVLYNVYTERLRQEWALRSAGDGWES